jgi:hypothetical protein
MQRVKQRRESQERKEQKTSAAKPAPEGASGMSVGLGAAPTLHRFALNMQARKTCVAKENLAAD